MKVEYNFIEMSTLEEFAKKHYLTLVVTERTKKEIDFCASIHGGYGHRFYVEFKHGDIKKGIMLHSTFGNGNTIEDAVNDYAKKISGEILVIDALTENRREIRVPQLSEVL